MTRINVVPPAELTDAHLGAEYRELPRVFSLVRKLCARTPRERAKTLNKIPTHYVLGPGHVLFFYDKLTWLSWRYAQIVFECHRRGRAVHFPELDETGIATELFGWWEPDEAALALNRSRIQQRLSESQQRKVK